MSGETVEVEKAEQNGALAAAEKAPASLRVIFGRKAEMTQIFSRKYNRLYDVSAVMTGPCRVLGVKTADGPDGYGAVRIAYGACKEKNLPKSVLGLFKKAGVPPSRWIREARVKDVSGFKVGQEIALSGMFKVGDYVDAQGISKGKGFAGAMKRHGFRGLPASHGASDKQRSPGSLASRRALGRVLPGQRMAGRMGHESATVQKLEVVQVDFQSGAIYLNGSVPGPIGGLIRVSETVKARKFRVDPVKSSVKKDKMGNIIGKKPTAAKKP